MIRSVAAGSTLALLAVAACSSAGHSHPSGPTSSSATSSTPVSIPADTPTPASIDLSTNWTEMKKTLQKDWDAQCLLSYACTGKDALDGSSISASFVDVPGQESITVSYVATDPSDDDGAKLDLGHFAMFFSTDAGTQFDFEKAVTDGVDETPLGGHSVTTFDPVDVIVQHPTDAKWQFKIQQSGKQS